MVWQEAWDDVFTARFLTSLDEVGTILRRGLPTLLLEEADRLVPMFGRLSREVMASVVSVTHGSHHEIFCAQAEPIPRLMLSTVDAEAAHFPPCMHQLHATLRTGHRLKHHYRVVYTLYLKGLGLSVGDQLSLWEAEHRKVVTLHLSSCWCRWTHPSSAFLAHTYWVLPSDCCFAVLYFGCNREYRYRHRSSRGRNTSLCTDPAVPHWLTRLDRVLCGHLN